MSSNIIIHFTGQAFLKLRPYKESLGQSWWRGLFRSLLCVAGSLLP